MNRKVTRTLVAGATAVAVAFSTVPAASASPFSEPVTGGLGDKLKSKSENEKVNDIMGLLSSDGKDPVEGSNRPVEGQLLDLLSSETEAEKAEKDKKKKEQDELLKGASSSEKIAYGIFGKGFSNTTDDAAKTIAIVLDAGLAVGIVVLVLAILNAAASMVTIGQALPNFGL